MTVFFLGYLECFETSVDKFYLFIYFYLFDHFTTCVFANFFSAFLNPFPEYRVMSFEGSRKRENISRKRDPFCLRNLRGIFQNYRDENCYQSMRELLFCLFRSVETLR